MRLLRKFLVALGAAVTLNPAIALAQPARNCEAEFFQDSATIELLATEIGPGRRAFGEEVVRLVADETQQGAACQVNLRVSRLTSDPTFPDYRFLVLGRPLLPTVNEAVVGAQNQIQVTIPRNRTGRTLNLQAAALAEWGTRAGRHNEQLLLSLISQEGQVLDRMALNLVYDVPKSVDVMFVGATGRGRTNRIDLGPLSATQPSRSEPFGLRVWSTSGYRVELSSENSGTLVHREGMDAIPYRLEIDGRDLTLGTAPTSFTTPDHTSRLGDVYRLGVLVPARRSVAGRYQDRITVSVSAI